MSPRSITMVPLTVLALGKAKHRPPGQCEMVLGRVVYPHPPPQGASLTSTVMSVPAVEVTLISLACINFLIPALTFGSRSWLGIRRSSASGCSFETMRMRLPPARISGSSGAWRSPSTVQSTTKSTEERAPITAFEPAIASDAPVERIGTGADCRSVGKTM